MRDTLDRIADTDGHDDSDPPEPIPAPAKARGKAKSLKRSAVPNYKHGGMNRIAALPWTPEKRRVVRELPPPPSWMVKPVKPPGLAK